MSDPNLCNPPARSGLIIHGGALGDFILSLRIVEAMRTRRATSITLLARRAALDLAPAIAAGQILDLDTGGFHTLFGAEPLLSGSNVRQLLSGFDVTVNFLGGDGGLTARLTEITGGPVLDLDPRPRTGDCRHITDQWLSQLGWRDTNDADRAPRVVPPVTAQAEALRRLHELTPDAERLAMIHPGSGGRAKCWPLERYLRLADQLRERDWQIIGMLGPAELEQWDGSTRARMAGAMPVVSGEELGVVAAMLAQVTAFVGNDSGVTHLSAATGTPTLAIFGPTDPRVWRPLGRCTIAMHTGRDAWPEVEDVLASFSALTENAPKWRR